MISALAGSDKPPAAGEITTTPEDRFIALARPAPDTVRFLNTADRTTAETLAR